MTGEPHGDTSDDRRRRFAEVVAVGQAEEVVSTARLDQLTEAQVAAKRRISAARGQVTKAQRDGSAAKIEAANRRLRERHDDFDAVSREVLDEMKQIHDQRAATNREVLDLLHQSEPFNEGDRQDGPS